MPHQCVRCGKFYDDGSNDVLKGCSCGARLFFYVKKEKVEQAKEIQSSLTEPEKTEIENDVCEILEVKEGAPVSDDDTVVLDIESIRIIKPGKYELDLVHLFKGDPVIYKLAEGKYMIDVPETFRNMAKKIK